MSAGAEIKDESITEGDELFSVACGLIPYPHHTDGPRLMMGGKNMKQAEIGITGAEPPIVPGYYEGIYSADIEILRSHMKDKRFFPYFGLNALTVIMPFKGYTYEDGLVISESLASRLAIKDGKYNIAKTFKVIINESELNEKGLKIDDSDKIFTFNHGDKYIYGDILPKPAVNFYSIKTSGKIETWREKYDHHSPGISDKINIRSIIKKISGSKNDKQYQVEFIISWQFIVERPMSIGDKLTGRNGNKGVVTKIIPDDEMPQIHFPDGSLPAELIISPCSILGRKNLGQIWEMTHSLLIMKGGGKHVRAFAGWQYFCRLHHHAWKKLQARGVNAPCDFYNGQPIRCGALTGQRMGERENWALLSHGANSVLSDMRINQTGNYKRTRELLRKILRSLGIIVSENESGLNFSLRENNDDNLERKSLRNYFSSDSENIAFCGTITQKQSPLDLAQKTLSELSGKQSSVRIKSAVKRLSAIINYESLFNPDGSIHIEPDILNYSAEINNDIQEYGSAISVKRPSLKKLLHRFCIDKNPLNRAEALINYRDSLIQILSGKTGIPRGYMSGRRYNHSGRAVIVPEPSLNVDCVYIPAAMLIEILDGYDDIYINSMPESLRDFHKLRKIFNDYYNNKSEAKELAKNGDTMAVFIPPYKHARDLSRYSILNNPGLIGNGKIAFADSLDLVLGFWNMQSGSDKIKLSQHISEILKNTPREKLRGTLRKFQADIAEYSSGAATLTPIEFENLSRDLSNNNFAHGLNILINSGAKGSYEDILKIVKSIGDIDMMRDTDENSEAVISGKINGNFWQGLSDLELFKYSYPSRFSMAQKKLSVAEAGYLSRLLAEKLYECTININDCGTSDGIEISYSRENDRLIIDGEILPTLGDLYKDLERVLYGRVIVGKTCCLDSEGVKSLLISLKNGVKIKLRSPLHCREIKNGHICAMCYGADVALKPYDKPELVRENFAAGLTAAEAIGERGTQLAMKRFNDVGSNTQSPIKSVRKYLAGKNIVSIADVLNKILTSNSRDHTANKELPQFLIHFETAAAFSEAIINDRDKYISDIAGEKITRFLVRKPGADFHFSDSLSTIKSPLLWK